MTPALPVRGRAGGGIGRDGEEPRPGGKRVRQWGWLVAVVAAAPAGGAVLLTAFRVPYDADPRWGVAAVAGVMAAPFLHTLGVIGWCEPGQRVGRRRER